MLQTTAYFLCKTEHHITPASLKIVLIILYQPFLIAATMKASWNAISRLGNQFIAATVGSNKYNPFFKFPKSLAVLFLILDNLSASSWVKKAMTGYQFKNVLSRRAGHELLNSRPFPCMVK